MLTNVSKLLCDSKRVMADIMSGEMRGVGVSNVDNLLCRLKVFA